MKIKFNFVVKTSGTNATIFLFNPTNPTQGEWVQIKKDAGKWIGEHPLNPGIYGYVLNIRAGQPESKWTLTMQRDKTEPIERTGHLNGKGNGGRIAEITLS